MRLSKFPFPQGLRVMERHAELKTSDLLAQGLVVTMAAAGVPLYSPIGERMLSRIERHLEEGFARAGFDLIRLPSLVHTSDLRDGETVGEKFASKLVHLQPPLDEFHLLSTPEMTLVRTIGPAFSHTQLPMRMCYTADFFRSPNDLKKLRVGRQFRIFGAFCFEPDQRSAIEAMAIIDGLLESRLADFGLSACLWQRDEKHFEVFYSTPEGGYAADYFDVAPSDSERLLSLGMAYFYGRDAQVPARMRTRSNRNAPLNYVTFGLCTNRVLLAAFDAGRCDGGFRLPWLLKPFAVSVVPRRVSDTETAMRLVQLLEDAGFEVALDDRFKLPGPARCGFARSLDIPVCVIAESGALSVGADDRSDGLRPVTSEEVLALVRQAMQS